VLSIGTALNPTSQKCAVVPRRARTLRRIDSCITQLKAQRTSRTCNESKEEEEADWRAGLGPLLAGARFNQRRSLSRRVEPPPPLRGRTRRVRLRREREQEGASQDEKLGAAVATADEAHPAAPPEPEVSGSYRS